MKITRSTEEAYKPSRREWSGMYSRPGRAAHTCQRARAPIAPPRGKKNARPTHILCRLHALVDKLSASTTMHALLESSSGERCLCCEGRNPAPPLPAANALASSTRRRGLAVHVHVHDAGDSEQHRDRTVTRRRCRVVLSLYPLPSVTIIVFVLSFNAIIIIDSIRSDPHSNHRNSSPPAIRSRHHHPTLFFSPSSEPTTPAVGKQDA